MPQKMLEEKKKKTKKKNCGQPNSIRCLLPETWLEVWMTKTRGLVRFSPRRGRSFIKQRFADCWTCLMGNRWGRAQRRRWEDDGSDLTTRLITDNLLLEFPVRLPTYQHLYFLSNFHSRFPISLLSYSFFDSLTHRHNLQTDFLTHTIL